MPDSRARSSSIGGTSEPRDWPTGDVVVDGVPIHYQRTGGGRPVLVLLHGIIDDGGCWTRVAADLEGSFDVVMADARGHGRSGRAAGDLTVPRLAADVTGLLDGLAIRRAILMGHSMGAITAAAVAAERPDLVDGLVLEDPPLDVETPPAPEVVSSLAALLRFGELPENERHAAARAENPGWDQLETDRWADAKAYVEPDVPSRLGSLGAYDWRAAFARLRCPGLLVIGDRERGAVVGPQTARTARALWPAGRLVHVAGAGHSIHRDRWDDAMRAVRAFLDERRVLDGQAMPSWPGDG